MDQFSLHARKLNMVSAPRQKETVKPKKDGFMRSYISASRADSVDGSSHFFLCVRYFFLSPACELSFAATTHEFERRKGCARAKHL